MNQAPLRTLIESVPAPVSRSEAEQVRAIAALMDSDGGSLNVTESPNGPMVEAVGCVGEVRFEDGTGINILPHLPPELTPEGPARSLMEMLYSIFGISSRERNEASLFEFFVRIFADEVDRLIVKGLRSKYHSVSGNEKAFKGRIVFNEHIRRNYIHKERIYVEYETFSQDRPENRLIKTTVAALLRKTADGRNARRLKTILLAMEDIPESTDVDRDFSMQTADRNMADYKSPLMWCNIFLRGMRMAGSSGARFCYALTVDEDTLYGAYVARASSVSRTDGSYRMKYRAETSSEDNASSIRVRLDWSFFDRARGTNLTDAAYLYMSAPGYRPIPHGGGDTVKAMAGSYLSEALSQ
ncbi:MAG: 5-methylcytosine restriction system specificity protein McrC [Methanomethylophilus sp.]